MPNRRDRSAQVIGRRAWFDINPHSNLVGSLCPRWLFRHPSSARLRWAAALVELGNVLVNDVFVSIELRRVPGEQASPVAIIVLGKQRSGEASGDALCADADGRHVARNGAVT